MEITHLLEEFRDDQLDYTLELEAYKAERLHAEKEQETEEEPETIQLPDNESSGHSPTGPDNTSPTPPHTTKRATEQPTYNHSKVTTQQAKPTSPS